VQEDHKKCYRCKEKGHIAKNCPGKKRNAADAFFVGMVLSGEDADNNGDNSDSETERERAINDLSMEARLRHLREENDVAEPEEKVEAEPEAKVEEESEEDDLESIATDTDKKVVSDEEFVTPTGPFIGGICPNPNCQARGMAGMPCIACHEGRILRPLTREERTPQFPGRCLQCGRIGKFGDDCENPNCQYGTYSVPEVPDSEQPSPKESNTSSQDYSHCEDSREIQPRLTSRMIATTSET